MKRKDFHPFTNISALRLSLTISILLNAILFLGYIYNKSLGQLSGLRLLFAFLSDFVMFYLLYTFNFKTLMQNWNKRTKGWIIIVGSLIIAIVLSLFYSKFAIQFLPAIPIPDNLLVITNLIKGLIIYIMVLLSTSLLYSIDQGQKTLLENERLIADNIRIRYEVLKNQVDPHFLFNSLNTLDGLISMDSDKAHEYVQHLSQVFRYAIGNKEIMYLNEELNFTESYAHLMKIRYGENFQIKYNIDEKYKNWYIMPISLQLLVENAVKHNVISTKFPLVLTIETTPNDTIRVMNAIQIKKEDEQGEGIGLANLTERYELLFQKEVLITMTDVFIVEIPLIKELEDNKFKNNRDESSNNRRRACCNTEFAAFD
jgi:sensor histidine kinase YesM